MRDKGQMVLRATTPVELGPAWDEQQRAQAYAQAARVLQDMDDRGLLPQPQEGAALAFYRSVLLGASAV